MVERKIRLVFQGIILQLIEWSEEFSVGHQDIDGQHKCLLDIVNTLALEIEQPSAKSLESILNSLVQYTAHHFSYEELIFKDAGTLSHPRTSPVIVIL